MLPLLYLAQVCTFVETPFGKRYFRIPGEEQDAYIFFWNQSLEHGNELVGSNQTVDVLPLLDFDSPYFEASAEQLWKDYGVLGVRLNPSPAVIGKLRDSFRTTIRSMRGNMGPCARLGLFSGGGLPHSDFSLLMRKLKGVRETWELVQRVDGRFQETLSYSLAYESMLATQDRSRSKTYQGLKGHKDTDVVKNAKEVFFNQSAIILWPPEQGYYRTGCLTAPLAVTEWTYRQTLVCCACRYSQAESGSIGKGPNERPTPSYIHGGPLLSLPEARKLSNADLRKWIVQNCSSAISASLPAEPSPAYLRRERKHLESNIETVVGKPISTVAALERGFATGNVRSTLIRALLGGMELTDLWSVRRGAPIGIAHAVFKKVIETHDVTHISRWVGNAGQYRRAKDDITIQVSPRKRKRHAV